jgi:hypothetical protein
VEGRSQVQPAYNHLSARSLSVPFLTGIVVRTRWRPTRPTVNLALIWITDSSLRHLMPYRVVIGRDLDRQRARTSSLSEFEFPSEM